MSRRFIFRWCNDQNLDVSVVSNHIQLDQIVDQSSCIYPAVSVAK